MGRQIILSLLAAGGVFAQVPSVPAPAGALFPEFRLADTAAAQALFRPMEGSLPVTLMTAGERQWVRLPVNFAGTTHDRASWDVQVKADLAVTKGIEFDLYSPDSGPIASLAVYLRSGAGWYRAGVGVERDGAWTRVLVDKADTSTEGTPAGWSEVDAIRLSAWRGEDRDTFLGIANLRPVGANAGILVVRAESCAGPDNPESKGYAKYAGTVASCLSQAGVECALLADRDVTAERLVGRKLVILPYNPRLPDGMLGLLQDFVGKGGRVMSFYSLAEGIPELIGVKRGKWGAAPGGPYRGFTRVAPGLDGQPAFVGQRSWVSQPAEPIPGTSRAVAVWRAGDGKDTDVPAIVVSDRGAHVGHVWLSDDWDNKKTLLLSLVAVAVPGVWQQAAESERAKVGCFAGFSSAEEAFAALKAMEANEQAVSDAVALFQRSKALLGHGDWLDSIDKSQAAGQALLRAWCMAQGSVPNEVRAFWCHSAFGVAGKSWDQAISQLADNGFTSILPNMLWGGVAYYPSKVLPEYAELAEKGDQLAACLAACRKHGVECHVWKVNWNMGSRANPEFVARMVAEKRVQVSSSGEAKERWLCPSHPENQALEVAAMVEVARNYAVDGIHFDYIRYPGGDYCFCDGCRSRFEKVMGQAVAKWPEDVKRGGPFHGQWLDFRRSNIDTVVRQVSEQARAVRPGIKISAAVFRNWPVDRDGVGQDWKLWCDRGWVDFLCPMDYTESNATFRNQVKSQLGYAGKVPVYPGIGLSCWRNPQDAVKLIEQIGITRRLGTGGFTVFQYGTEMESVLPLLSLGTTKRK